MNNNNNKPIIAATARDKSLFVNAVDLYNALGVSLSYSDWLRRIETDYWADSNYELFIDEEGIEWIRASYAKALCHVVDYPHSDTVVHYIRELDRKWREQMDTPTTILACGVIEYQRRVDKLTGEISELRRKLTALTPKADYFDRLVESRLYTTIDATAQELGVPLDDFRDLLLRYHYVRRKSGELRATKLAVDEGLFLDNRKRITPKGYETFRLLCSVFI